MSEIGRVPVLARGFVLMPANVWKGCYAGSNDCRCIGDFTGYGQSSSRDNSVARYSTRQGNVIQVHPSDVRFQVPESWQRYATFLLTAREVRKAAVSGEEIVNAALNWRDCAAQIGGGDRRWLRAYVVDGPEGVILKRIQEKGLAAAAKMPNYMQYDGHITAWGASPYEFTIMPTREDRWEHVDIPYSKFFGDYSGDDYVSFYLRPVGGRELVLAVGYFVTGCRATGRKTKSAEVYDYSRLSYVGRLALRHSKCGNVRVGMLTRVY